MTCSSCRIRHHFGSFIYLLINDLVEMTRSEAGGNAHPERRGRVPERPSGNLTRQIALGWCSGLIAGGIVSAADVYVFALACVGTSHTWVITEPCIAELGYLARAIVSSGVIRCDDTECYTRRPTLPVCLLATGINDKCSAN